MMIVILQLPALAELKWIRWRHTICIFCSHVLIHDILNNNPPDKRNIRSTDWPLHLLYQPLYLLPTMHEPARSADDWWLHGVFLQKIRDGSIMLAAMFKLVVGFVLLWEVNNKREVSTSALLLFFGLDTFLRNLGLFRNCLRICLPYRLWNFLTVSFITAWYVDGTLSANPNDFDSWLHWQSTSIP